MEYKTELTLVLVVAKLTRTVRDEVKRMGWDLETLSKGYVRVVGVMYLCFIVVINDACKMNCCGSSATIRSRIRRFEPECRIG